MKQTSSTLKMSSVSIAIIGAGISGLVCARNLLHRFQSLNVANQKLSVTLFDKAAKAGDVIQKTELMQIGGRLSTRKGSQVAEGKFQFDHGAQYFTGIHYPLILLILISS